MKKVPKHLKAKWADVLLDFGLYEFPFTSFIVWGERKKKVVMKRYVNWATADRWFIRYAWQGSFDNVSLGVPLKRGVWFEIRSSSRELEKLK